MLKRRNGELIIQVTDLESEVRKLKKESSLVPKNQPNMFNTTTGFFPRPKTAIGRTDKLDDFFLDKDEDLETISKQLDEEMEEMLEQNQRMMREM